MSYGTPTNYGYAPAQPTMGPVRQQMYGLRQSDQAQLAQLRVGIRQDILMLRSGGATPQQIQARRQADWGQYRQDRLQLQGQVQTTRQQLMTTQPQPGMYSPQQGYMPQQTYVPQTYLPQTAPVAYPPTVLAAPFYGQVQPVYPAQGFIR